MIDITERGWCPDDSLLRLEAEAIKDRDHLWGDTYQIPIARINVGTNMPVLQVARTLSFPTIKSFRHWKLWACRIAHCFQKKKAAKAFAIVAIDIGDISFFFLGLLLTLRCGYNLFLVNGTTCVQTAFELLFWWNFRLRSAKNVRSAAAFLVGSWSHHFPYWGHASGWLFRLNVSLWWLFLVERIDDHVRHK